MAKKFSSSEIEQHLKTTPGWEVKDGELIREFNFEAYQAGLVFAAHVGYLADGMDHHPDMMIGYKKVVVKLSTHSVGGLSELDFKLAQKI